MSYQEMVEFDFLIKFGWTFVDIFYLTLVGGVVGTILANVVNRRTSFPTMSQKLLHPIPWFPFFIIVALPERQTWWLSIGLAAGMFSVASFTYCYVLAVRSAVSSARQPTLLYAGRAALLHAFLFSIYYQIQQGAGWIAELSQRNVACYLVLLALCAFLYLINRLSQTTFEQVAERDARALIDLLQNPREKYSLTAAFLLGVGFILVWYVFDDFVIRYLRVGNPLDVLNAGYHAVVGPNVQYPMAAGRRYWEFRDLFFSLGEIILGLTISVALSFVVVQFASANPSFRPRLFPLLNLTFGTPMVLVLCLSNLLGRSLESVLTTSGISLLSFYPVVKVFWACRGLPRPLMVTLGFLEALPFAFVAMIFGELWSASAGMAFITTIFLGQLKINEAMAMALLTLGIFLLVVILLRSLGRKLAKALPRRVT